MMKLNRIIAPMALAASAALSSCSSDKDKAPTCPYAAVLAPVSTLTTFQPDKTDDPAGELYTVGIVHVETKCDFDPDNGTTNSSLEIRFKAKHAPTEGAKEYRVPYFVAVALDGKILNKRDVWLRFGFPPGSPTTTFTDSVASIVVNLENGKRPYDYEIVVGFQLTKDQLDYNKKMSRYTL